MNSGTATDFETSPGAGGPVASGPAVVRFVLDGKTLELPCPDPTETVLDMLRYRLRRTGTKEGCAEGDCGACTIVLGERGDDGRIVRKAVNACILFVPMLDGREVVTVESLATDGRLHPVQREMVERHGSQCGFCTPGFVMSLYARSIGAEGMRADVPVAEAISGNLCRCTGYGPILAAGEAVPPAPLDDSDIAAALEALARPEPLIIDGADAVDGTGRRWMAPRDLDQLAAMRAEHPDAHILSGGTDVGLWVTKQHRRLDKIIWLGEVAELRRCEADEAGLTLGAGVTYTAARAELGRLHPDLDELIRRIGGPQVRNSGTIGGNIANGSPIGDMPPALIALNAEITLRRGGDRRTMALEDYFIAYGEQDLRPGEFLETIRVPRPAAGTRIAITKLSKRFASDISAVLGAFVIAIEDGRVTSARLAFGGMAGIPRRAATAEAVLAGAEWSRDTIERAVAALAADFQPLTDMRGSASYRLAAAGNLLRRFWLAGERPDEPLSVLDLAHDAQFDRTGSDG